MKNYNDSNNDDDDAYSITAHLKISLFHKIT